MFEPDSSARVLLASDLDGTLLGSDGQLSAATADVVNRFVSGGGLFTYASARSYTSASRVTSSLDLRHPVVTYGGSVVVDPTTGAARSAAMMSRVIADAVLEAAAESPTVRPVLYAMHGGADRVCWLADSVAPGGDDFLSARRGDPRLMPLAAWEQIAAADIFQVALIGERAPLAELRASLEPSLDCHLVLFEDSSLRGTWLLEISAHGGTKGVALAGVKQELGADQLVCFGDNHNDLPMFAIADYAIAVGNAEPEVRAAADEVIDANDADGVARWIASYLSR